MLAYFLGSIVGGLIIGILLAWFVGIVTVVPPTLRLLAASVVAIAALRDELVGTMRWWPEFRRQVPRHWLERGASKAAFRFGIVLGFGAATYIRHAGSYALVALLAATGSMSACILAGVAFGAARGVQPALLAFANTDLESARRLERVMWAQRIDRYARLCVVAVVAVGFALTAVTV